jgi:outer membrane protein OmpA-like peptidoglycan-associated protein
MRRIFLLAALLSTVAVFGAACASDNDRYMRDDQAATGGAAAETYPAAQVDAQGPASGGAVVAPRVANWMAYHQFNFSPGNADVTDTDMQKATTISTYLARNPSLGVGINGFRDSEKLDRHDRELNNQRTSAVRDALLQAGVPAEKIQIGSFTDRDHRHDDQIAVLIKTRI